MRHAELVRRSVDLRALLAGDRGLLFSHPADFEETGFERDRWLALLHDAFVTRRVLPLISAARIGDGQWGWVWSIDARSCYVGAPAGEPVACEAVTAADRGPLPHLLSAGRGHARFVACVDPDGRCTALHEYDGKTRPRSVFDLVDAAAQQTGHGIAGRTGVIRARGA